MATTVDKDLFSADEGAGDQLDHSSEEFVQSGSSARGASSAEEDDESTDDTADEDADDEELEPSGEEGSQAEGQEMSYDDLRSVAQRAYGMSDAQLQAFNTPESLRAAMEMVNEQYRTASRQQQPLPQNQQANQQQTALEELVLEGLDDLPEDDPIRKNLTKLAEHNKSLRQELLSERQQREQEAGQRAFTQFMGSVEKALGSLDPVLYGKSAKDRTPVQESLIQEVLEPAIAFAQQAAARGEDIFQMDLEPLVTRAAYSVHYQKLLKRTNDKRADAIRKRHARRSSANTHNHIGPKRIPKNLETFDPAEDEETMERVNKIFERANNR